MSYVHGPTFFKCTPLLMSLATGLVLCNCVQWVLLWFLRVIAASICSLLTKFVAGLVQCAKDFARQCFISRAYFFSPNYSKKTFISMIEKDITSYSSLWKGPQRAMLIWGSLINVRLEHKKAHIHTQHTSGINFSKGMGGGYVPPGRFWNLQSLRLCFQ